MKEIKNKKKLIEIIMIMVSLFMIIKLFLFWAHISWSWWYIWLWYSLSYDWTWAWFVSIILLIILIYILFFYTKKDKFHAIIMIFILSLLWKQIFYIVSPDFWFYYNNNANYLDEDWLLIDFDKFVKEYKDHCSYI